MEPRAGLHQDSPGCKHCYAETFAERFRGVPGHPYEQGFDLRLIPEKIMEPLLWRKPKTVFVNSMSDLFQEHVPDEYIQAVVQVMELADWHTYQVLTKRADRMSDLLQSKLASAAKKPHIWWGVSVEDKRYGVPRIEHLRAAPARVRFLSIEPLLDDVGILNLDQIHWVIVGGESGPGARKMNPEWALSLREQCERAKVPFFFKQWGGVQKSKAGRLLDGTTYDNLPARSVSPVPDREKLLALIRQVEPVAEFWRGQMRGGIRWEPRSAKFSRA